ncbi:unnamed protein product [Rotaria sp. Silwood1]|nr:unnamed protein product [Rotaria sp. Silwood1]
MIEKKIYQHVKITFIDKTNNETHYLKPTAWASAKRWSSHADMIVQYAQCIKGKLKEHGYDDVELHFDIWRSMNGRFNQRQIDPRIDLLSSDVKWSPFKDTSWLQPLLTNLSDWRTRMLQIENDLSSKDQNVLITFVADFPGLFLENYIPPDLNTTIEVLEGEITVELISLQRNITLNVGQNISVPSGDYHNVYTISSTPSCYMYVYLNQSDADIVHLWDRFYNLTDRLLNETIDRNRPLHSDKQEADLVRLSYENVFEQLRDKTLHELLELPNDYKIHNKNESNINWTNIRLQFETSMNRSMVKRLDTKTEVIHLCKSIYSLMTGAIDDENLFKALTTSSTLLLKMGEMCKSPPHQVEIDDNKKEIENEWTITFEQFEAAMNAETCLVTWFENNNGNNLSLETRINNYHQDTQR